MGITSGVAGALFGSTQLRVLGLLFGQPDRSFRVTELIALARSGTGAVHRELFKLEQVGLVSVTRLGNQKYLQANRASPIFPELNGLIAKTVGLAEPLRQALAPLAARIRAAVVFGSVARGTDSSKSDVDLLVLSSDLSHADLFQALQVAERALGRPVNPTVMTPNRWKARLKDADSFAARIASGPTIPVLGSLDDASTA